MFVDTTDALSADLAAVESDSRDKEVVAASTDAKSADADSMFVVEPPGMDSGDGEVTDC